MYDKQKMMLAYVLVFMGLIATKVAFQSAKMSMSIIPHVIGTVVVLCALTLLIQQAPIKLNLRASIGLLTIYAFDIYFAYFDNRFLLTPLALIVLLLVAGALLEKSVVLAALIGCNILTLICCLLWPDLIFATMGKSQMLYMMVIADATGILMYIMTRWASQVIEQSNEKAKEADLASTAKGRFLASVSHEIRTPMNAIFGMNELILAASQSANIDELKQNAVYIKTAGLGLLDLINDILDISKMERGKMELVETPYNAAQLFQSLADELQGKIGMRPIAKHVDIVLPISEHLIGDDVRIRQVVMHLLDNAIKFTSEGFVEFTVRQSAAPEGVCLMISVSDTGCGMSEESIQHIRNVLVDDYFKDSLDSEGIGIGLTIVIRLLDMMNGTLEINSELGKGTSLTAKIPQRISPVAVEVVEPGMPQTLTLSGARILVVDDNSTNIQVCRGIFKRYALNIDTALSGQEAVNKAEMAAYDIIFMDHMMPGMDGVQALKAIRELGDEHNSHVPIVVLTADNSAEQERYLLKCGFDAYLCKPIDTLELTRIFRTHLAGLAHVEKSDNLAPQYALGLVLPGVNVQKGIQRTGGTLESYIEVLRTFERTGPNQARAFESAANQNDMPALALEAHTLKAVSDSIGAERLASMSAAIEQQAKSGQHNAARAGVGPLLSELHKLLETISTPLRHQSAKPAAPTEPALDTRALIERLKVVCAEVEAYDLDAASEVVHELLSHSSSVENNATLAEIMTSIQNYAYASTVEKTQAFISRLEASMSSGGDGT